MKQPVELPRKLSALLRLAVRDARACAADPRFTFDMGSWVSPLYRGRKRVCAVCMAGAVMVQTLKARRTVTSVPGSSEQNAEQLYAINEMRVGRMTTALAEIFGSFERRTTAELRALEASRRLIEERYRSAWGRRNRRAPWATYMQAARTLEAAGL